MILQKTFTGLGSLLLMVLMVMVVLTPLLALGNATPQSVNLTLHTANSASSGAVWLSGHHSTIHHGLQVRDHAHKHGLEAYQIYADLLAGKCAASMTWCGGSDLEKLHVCQLPNGVVGAILQFGNEITTGYYGRDGYWEKRVTRDNWEVCE